MASEIEHDWERWGSVFTSDGRECIRIADVVKSRLSEKHPLKLAADEVLETIARVCGIELFLLRNGNVPAALNAGDRWTAPLLAESWFGYDVEDAHESEFLQWWDWTDGATDPFNEAKGDPRRLSGALGLLGCMHYLWTQRAVNADDLDKRPTGATAILKTDAQRLFGFDDAAAVHQLRPVQPAAPEALVTEPPAAMELDGASLLRRQAELIEAKHKAPTQQLVEETGLHEKEIQRRMKPHRATSAPQPCLHNVWGGSRKVHKLK